MGMSRGGSDASFASTAYGKVPRWGRAAQIRNPGVLERQLTWAYYQVRQSPKHPMRKEVGEYLPVTDVPAEMRRGQERYFRFWRDARPPFRVGRVERVDELERDASGTNGSSLASASSRGRLYHASYECGIEYVSEHSYGETASDATFNNMVRGIATVRISDAFPKNSRIEIVSWGRPVLIPKPEPARAASSSSTQRKRHGGIPADQWSPLASLLGLNPDHPRLARSRRAAECLSPHGGPDVDVLQKVLLGCHTHTTLPRIAQHLDAASALAYSNNGYLDGGGTAGMRGTSPTAVGRSDAASPEKRKRERRVWTAAAGFLSYVG